MKSPTCSGYFVISYSSAHSFVIVEQKTEIPFYELNGCSSTDLRFADLSDYSRSERRSFLPLNL